MLPVLRADLSLRAHGYFGVRALSIDTTVVGRYPQGKRWKLRLHEKGGKEHVVPVHHILEEHLDGLPPPRRSSGLTAHPCALRTNGDRRDTLASAAC